jgi:hypothetical protein
MPKDTEGQKPVPGGRCEICLFCAPSGECLDDAIKSGHCGDWIWYLRGSKQCRRRYARPNDPKTPRQLYWRALLGAASRKYSHSLTAERRAACIAAGKKLRSRPRLGLSGPLTGQLYWVRQECAGRAEGRVQSAGKQFRTPHSAFRTPGRQGMRSRSTWECYRSASVAPLKQCGRLPGRRMTNDECPMTDGGWRQRRRDGHWRELRRGS